MLAVGLLLRELAPKVKVVWWPAHGFTYNLSDLTPPSGDYVIQITSLGPKEFFTIQILSYATLPQPLYIRSEAGHARQLPVHWVRWHPQWVIWMIGVFTISGFGFLTYWAIKAIHFVLKGVGAVV